jgi:hyperosmotically inducible protein
MNTRIQLVIATAILAVSGLAACQKTEPVAEGPAEKVGQKIDEAASKAAVHINAIAEKAGEGLSKAGEKIEQTAKDAQTKNDTQKDDASK